jgi:ABC-type transport system substrate-binding protein
LIAALSCGCTAHPPRDPFVLKIALGGTLGEFSPTEEPGWASIAAPWVFERFVSLDPKGELTPILATRVVRSADGVIHLEALPRGNFSDGSPIEVGDLIRSLEAAGLRVTAQGRTFALVSRKQGLPVDALLLRAVVFRGSPGHYVGSGPFTVASQTSSEFRLIRRTPQPGRINDVRLVVFPSPRDAYTRALKGDANFVFDLEPRWVEFFQGVPSMQVVRIPPKNTDSLIFNGRLPRAERRALAAALNTEQVRQLAYGASECAESRSATSPGANVPSGPPLRILSWGSFERLGLAARRALGARGGEVSFLDPQELLPRVEHGDYDLVTVHPTRWPPSALALNWRTGSPYNLFGYSNAQLDRAIDAGDWGAAEEALLDDPPGAFICTRDFFAVLDARVRNASFGPYEILETLPDWEVQ